MGVYTKIILGITSSYTLSPGIWYRQVKLRDYVRWICLLPVWSMAGGYFFILSVVNSLFYIEWVGLRETGNFHFFFFSFFLNAHLFICCTKLFNWKKKKMTVETSSLSNGRTFLKFTEKCSETLEYKLFLGSSNDQRNTFLTLKHCTIQTEV